MLTATGSSRVQDPAIRCLTRGSRTRRELNHDREQSCLRASTVGRKIKGVQTAYASDSQGLNAQPFNDSAAISAKFETLCKTDG